MRTADTACQRIAAFAVNPASSLPRESRRVASRIVLDSLAVTLAGWHEPGPQALQRALLPSGDAAAVRVPWSGARYSPDDACLLFGMSSHVLDYDDVSMLSVCHPSVPVFSALYVLAQQVRVSGADFLDALAVGTEVLIRSGQAMGFRHYDLGFHATATLGTLGVAAACARVLGLSVDEATHALAIAASSSAGVRTNFGTMVKSLHVGQAASSGLRAARFARAGVQGAADALEGRGWLHAFSGGEVSQWPVGLALGQPFAMVDPGFEQKRYPCCYMMHKIIQATLDLRREHGLSLEGFDRAQVLMPSGGCAPLIHPIPSDGLSAKFSGPYAVVGALQDGRVNLASFDDSAVSRAAVRRAIGQVELTESASAAQHGSDVGGAPVSVTLCYADGRRYQKTITASPGSAQDPLTDHDLADKWRDCVTRGLPGMDARRVDELFDAGLAFASVADAGSWLLQFSQN